MRGLTFLGGRARLSDLEKPARVESGVDEGLEAVRGERNMIPNAWTLQQRTNKRAWRQPAALAIAVCAVFAAPLSAGDKAMLPDGTMFPFWDDQTNYRTTYHVACQDPQASDANPGSREKPFRTIGRAAEILQPGEKVVVHEGVYRECVSPRRGGTGPDAMIAYEAAPGERVVVSGARPLAASLPAQQRLGAGREGRLDGRPACVVACGGRKRDRSDIDKMGGI